MQIAPKNKKPSVEGWAGYETSQELPVPPSGTTAVTKYVTIVALAYSLPFRQIIFAFPERSP